MRHLAVAASAVLALGVLAAASAQEAKSAKDVMKIAHKGKESMLKKILAGKGSAEEHEKLVELYEVMAASKPPQGDEESWKKLNTALVAAAKDVLAGKEGGIAALKKASNCKGCHSVHRPKKK